MKNGFSKFTFLFLILGLCVKTTVAQTVTDLYKRVEQKINEDKKYLNAFIIQPELTDQDFQRLKNIPRLSHKRQPYSFIKSDGLTYIFEFLNETIETDSITLLRISEVRDLSATGAAGLFGQASGEAQFDTNHVLIFRDLENLYYTNNKFYNYLVDIIERTLEDADPTPVMTLKIDEKLRKSKGISAKNNLDYLNYQWVNSRHYFPKPLLKKRRRGRRKGIENFPYHSEVSFSHISFNDSKHLNLGYVLIGGEINTETDVLNLLPWQSMTTSFGIRAFITFSDAVQNIYDDFLLNVKVLARLRINSSGFVEKIPFMYTKAPKLNVSSGIVIDVNTTRFYGLPFFNLSFAGGYSDYQNPYVTFGTSDSSWAYFNSQAWEATMSFFWNNNERFDFRYRIDVGFGGFNADKVIYTKRGTEVLGKNYIKPVINYYFTFAPKKKELFGMKLRLFDSVIRAQFWLKFLEINKIHSFRFETEYISEPFFRSAREWENGNSAIFQIVYRLGL